MIEANRLEELIKQDATIYYADKEANIPIPIFLNKKNLDKKEESCGRDVISTEDLYETYKDAEWALKYQHIPRTDYLDLPTFEDFGKHPYLSFHDEIPDLYELKIDKNANIVLTLYRGGIYDCGIIKFSKEFTEENYAEVCDLCVKLFKGEA